MSVLLDHLRINENAMSKTYKTSTRYMAGHSSVTTYISLIIHYIYMKIPRRRRRPTGLTGLGALSYIVGSVKRTIEKISVPMSHASGPKLAGLYEIRNI